VTPDTSPCQNIRELQNLLERAVIVSKGPELQLPPEQLRVYVKPDTPGGARTLADPEREHILRVLRQVGWVDLTDEQVENRAQRATRALATTG